MTNNYKIVATVVFYDEDEKTNQCETIIFWAKDEVGVGKILKDRYGDAVVSYEVKWLNDGVLLLPDDADVVEKIINENSY